MAKQNSVQKIMGKPLSRKEFLQHIGLLLLAVVGVTKLMPHLLKTASNQANAGKATGERWGGGKFGV